MGKDFNNACIWPNSALSEGSGIFITEFNGSVVKATLTALLTLNI